MTPFTPLPAEPRDSQLDAAITRSLERQPAVAIPADFAARVRTSLPTLKPMRRRTPIARTVAIVAALVMLVSIFALAPHATPSFTNFSFDLELLLLAQLAGISYWVATKREA